MEKARFYELVKSRIEDYLSEESFELYGDEYDDRVSTYFEDVEGYHVEVELYITGYNKHDKGDYYEPPYDTGEINASVLDIEAWDREGELFLHEENVYELSTKIEY